MTGTLFTVDSYEDTEEKLGKFRGVITSGDDVIFATKSTYKKKEYAERHARQEFRKALYDCKHEYGAWGEEIPLDTEWGGTEYMRQQECKHCGLTRYDYSDRSMYDADRDY